MNFRQSLILHVLLVATTTAGISCRAAIHRWDTGAVIPETEGIEPGPGVHLGGRNLEFAALSNRNLFGASFSQSNLTNAQLVGSNLAGAFFFSTVFVDADLTGVDLTNAILDSAKLTNARMSGAIVQGANFAGASGFTKERLYFTASYQTKDLRGIVL